MTELTAPRIWIEFAASQRDAITKSHLIKPHALIRTEEFDDIFTELPVWRMLLHHYAN